LLEVYESHLPNKNTNSTPVPSVELTSIREKRLT
jgi:hypothetical protein